jgi:hypothetical protein
MNLPTPDEFTKERGYNPFPPRWERWLSAAREAILSAQPTAGRHVSIDEHPGKGTVINIDDTSARRPTGGGGGPTGACCTIQITNAQISGTINICSSTAPFQSPSIPDKLATTQEDGDCNTCNSLTCETSSSLTESGHHCPDGSNMVTTGDVKAVILCNEDGTWTVQVSAFGSAKCDCSSVIGFGPNVWTQTGITDPSLLPGTYMASGDFTASGQSGLTWSATVTITRNSDCNCPCRNMTITASATYPGSCPASGGGGTVSLSASTDWEALSCCANPLGEACWSGTPDAHGKFLTICINRRSVCNGIGSWQIQGTVDAALFGCGFFDFTDIADPPGTYDFTDANGNTYHVELSCA